MDETSTSPPRPEGSPSAGTTVDDLAAEYFLLLDGNEHPSLEDYLERLESDEDRGRFAVLVESARRAGGLLPKQLVPGEAISERYEILRPIGEGGMGRVFAARDRHMEREVAIKVLPALEVGDAVREGLLLKESRLLASLNHPNIVAVHEVGQDGDLMYVVMDLVDGESLSEVIENAANALKGEGRDHPRSGSMLRGAIGRSTPDGRSDLIEDRSWYRSAAAIVSELSATLEAAHARNVIHRDLKPKNIMLLGGGSPVVLDFGLAGNAELPAGEVTSNLYGSAAYLAPEQAKSYQVGADPRTDVYQLGLVLYELLTLRRAFTGDAIGPVLEKIRRGIFDSPRRVNPQVPPELDAICQRAMELDPQRRYQTAHELHEDLDRYLEGIEPPLAARFSFTRQISLSTRYFTRRHPRATVGVSLVALFLAVLLVWEGVYFSKPTIDPLLLVSGAQVPREELFSQVRKGDSVGVVVEGSDSSVVYAVSIFGSAEKKFVSPLKPIFLVDMPRSDEEWSKFVERAEWGLPVDSGRRSLWCMAITEDPAEVAPDKDGREGTGWLYEQEKLWVFAFSDRDPVIESWLEEMEGMKKEGDYAFGPGLPYEQAFAVLSSLYVPVPGRGQRLSALSEDERRERFQHLSREKIAGSEGWTLPRSIRAEWTFDVVSSE